MSKLSQCTHRSIEEENVVFLSYLDYLIIMNFFVDLEFGLGGLLLLLFCFVLLFMMKRHSAFTSTMVVNILYEIFKAIIKKSLS